MSSLSDNELIAQLNAENWHDRHHAARWLGARRAISAVPALVERLRDPRSHVQAAAALALGAIHDPETIPPLIDMFHGKTYGFMEEDGAPHRFTRILGSAGIALTGFNIPEAVEPVYDALRDTMASYSYGGDYVTLYMQADCVSYIGGERAYEMLNELWTDPKFTDVQVSVASSLGTCGVERALPELLKALSDDRVTVRAAAAEGLGLLGNTDAVDPLITLFLNADAGLEPNADPYFKDRLWEKAAQSLGRLNTNAACAALKTGLTLPERYFAAAVGLAYAKDPVARDMLTPFVLSLDHRRVGMRTTAAFALAALDDAGALAALQSYAQHVRVQDYALVEDAIDRWQGFI
ncbi:MAG: HEAT repeat domain-containing protein [Chloroflexota bacterium]